MRSIAMKLTVMASATCMLVDVTAAQEAAPTKDQLAWNHTWDVYEGLLNRGLGEDDRIIVMENPIPADWTMAQGNGGGRKVQTIAAALPGYVFTWQANAKYSFLHEAYRRYVSDVVIVMPTPEQQKELNKAREELRKASEIYGPAVTRYREEIDKERARREKHGAVLTFQDIQDIEQEKSYIIANAWQRLKQAYVLVSNVQVPNSTYMETITLLQQAADAAPLSQEGRGVWPYDFDGAAFSSVSGLVCDEKSDAGWKQITYNKGVTSQTIRSRGWNGGGKWSGSFFSVGANANASSYESTFTSDSDEMSVGLCGATPVVVKPGVWYSSGFLTEIEEGRIPLKPGSAAKLPIFGPKGAIPTVVTGVIIARQIRLKGRLSSETRSEIKKQSSGGGGFRVGSFRIGGSAGSSTYKYTENTETGEFLLVSAYDSPVIVAVVVKDTVGGTATTAYLP